MCKRDRHRHGERNEAIMFFYEKMTDTFDSIMGILFEFLFRFFLLSFRNYSEHEYDSERLVKKTAIEFNIIYSFIGRRGNIFKCVQSKLQFFK